jgi:hypothetical protein
LNLSDVTHAVLRFEDGHRTEAQLEVISLTGGVLLAAQAGGSGIARKADVCDSDRAVLGTAEMLNPVSWNQRPFRFVGLEGDDQRRLQESIQSSFGQVSKDQEWIDKYRAALDHQKAASPAPFQLAPGDFHPGPALSGECDLPLRYLQHPEYPSALARARYKPLQCELNDCTAAFSSSKISNRFSTPISFRVCTTNLDGVTSFLRRPVASPRPWP